MNTKGVHQIAIFAPAGCTGYPGAVGDTILQTTLLYTLANKAIFESLERVEWWCAPVAASLFKHELGCLGIDVVPNPWNGMAKGIPDPADAGTEFDLALVCMRHATETKEEVRKRGLIKQGAEIWMPEPPLDPQRSVHVTEQLHSCLRKVDVGAIQRPRIVPLEDERVWAQRKRDSLSEKWVSRNNLNAKDIGFAFSNFSLCSVAAGDPEKRWDKDKWVELVLGLLLNGPVWVWYGNTRDEENLAGAIEDDLKRELLTRDLYEMGVRVEKTELRQLAALASIATICIAPDSGPMHVMSASGACVINMVSKMNPETWRPLSEKVVTVGEWKMPLRYLTARDVLQEAIRELRRADNQRSSAQQND